MASKAASVILLKEYCLITVVVFLFISDVQQVICYHIL